MCGGPVSTKLSSLLYNLAHSTLHPWEWSQRPWQLVHADYASLHQGKKFLVLVDGHTKWMDVQVTIASNEQENASDLRNLRITRTFGYR